MPAARRHQQQRAAKPRLRNPRSSLREIASHHRLQIGIGAGGRETLVLAHLGRNLATTASRQRQAGAARALRRRGAHASGLVKLCKKPTATPRPLAPRARRWRARRPPRRAESERPLARRCVRGTGSRRRRGTRGGGRSMLTSYCSKRFSWRISTSSRKPSVVSSAVLAPLRSISALVASVVPWMISRRRAGSNAGLADDRAQDRQHALLRRARRGQDLSRVTALAELQRDVGERAADVDAEPDCGLRCHNRKAVPENG